MGPNSVEQKRNQLTIFRDCLELFETEPQEFLDRFVMMNEIWVHHYIPGSNQQSKQWKRAGTSPPRKAKAVLLANKVMASVF